MKRFTRLILVLVLLAAVLPAGVVSAQPQQQQALPSSCAEFSTGGQVFSGPMPSGQGTYCIILPPDLSQWSGGVVIFAHGYVFAYPPDKPVDIPWDQLILKDPTTGGIAGTIPQLVLGMNLAFATTSYSKNGLAMLEGVQSVVELVDVYKGLLAPYIGNAQVPVFLIGASEGGLVTTLAVEQHPEIFAGGVAACGPVGDFQKQVNYWGDLRVVYDVYFKGNGLGDNPMSISPEVMASWGSLANPLLYGDLLQQNMAMIAANPTGALRVVNAAQAPYVPSDPTTIGQTILGVLEYNVMATDEAKVELGGNPYSNIGKVYVTYPFDPSLNRAVQRISADRAVVKEIKRHYQTSGLLRRPLVLLHTTGDPIVPFWHTLLYTQKVTQTGSLANFASIPVVRYGHCAFKPEEALLAFQVMFLKANLQGLTSEQIQQALPDPLAQEEFLKLRNQFK